MVTVYFSPSYAQAGFAFPTTRKAVWIADSLVRKRIQGIKIEDPRPLEESEIIQTHDLSYVRAIQTGQPRELAESQGFTWDQGLWPMVLETNGGVVVAALRALHEGVAGSLSSGLHHARREHGHGYCTFNGLVIAAKAALGTGCGNVLILDFDAHCGGGTHSLIANDPHIWQVDVSVNSYDQYEPTSRTTLDVVTQADQYLPTIARRLREYGTRGFGLCLYNAGMDPHQDCPEGALAGITNAMLQERERMVFSWCRQRGLPVAFVMAGGYVQAPRMDELKLVDLHRLTLEAAAPGLRLIGSR